VSECPIRARGSPNEVIRDLDSVWVTAARKATLPGYVCVVSKQHVDEPFELPDLGRAQFWEESMQVARALAGLLRPKRLNYEIHGNTVRHLHMHLFPRFDDDPFEGRPIDGRERAFDRTTEDLRAPAEAIAG
jgi:diadenosine tetraphosphate (Ap4A) HIT family hydrolase